MKTVKMKSPISLLLGFIDDNVSKDVEKYLSDHDLNAGVVFMGKGTAESDIADIFGFGMSDRAVIACIIPNAKKDQIMKDIIDITGIETDNYGLVMSLKLQSADSNMLSMLNIKVDNDGNN